MPSTGTTSPARTSTQVAGRDPLGRHLLEPAVAVQPGRPGRPGQQRGQLAPRAPRRVALQRVAAREHQRDDRGRQLLAERQRPDDGDQGDDVNADAPREQGRTTDQPAAPARGARSPADGRAVAAGRGEDAADRDAGRRQRGQEQRRRVAQAAPRPPPARGRRGWTRRRATGRPYW